MDLTIKERILVLSALPKEGNIITLRIIRDLKEELGFSEFELKKFNFVQDEKGVRWDNKHDELIKNVPIGEKAHDVICDALKNMDAKGRLTEDYIGIYEKFVEKKENA